MCELCNAETRSEGLARRDRMEDNLIKLAAEIGQLGLTIDPHGDRAKRTGVLARAIIRELVQDWV